MKKFNLYLNKYSINKYHFMQHIIALTPIVPLRSGPSDKDEMVSQMMFGEYAVILDKQQNWSFVEMMVDGYQGWLSNSMVHTVPVDSIKSSDNPDSHILGNLFLPVVNKSTKSSFYIPAGSLLHHYKPASNSFIAGGFHFICKEEPFFYSKKNIRENIGRAALNFLNIPYLWGGKNPFGMDCSGFIQILFSLFGIRLPRNSRQQVKEGKTINFITESSTGDLAFFDNQEGEIIHTGIIINDMQILHASGQVRIDRIDHQGIYNNYLKQYTHKLRIVKSIID